MSMIALLDRAIDARTMRRAFRDRGVHLPRDVTILHDIDGMSLFHHYTASGINSIDPRLPLTDDVVESAVQYVARISHGKAWEKELKRRGSTAGIAPDGSRIVHPLALRLIMKDRERSVEPSTWENGFASTGAVIDIGWDATAWGAVRVTRLMLVDTNGKTGALFTQLPVTKSAGRADAQYISTTVLPETVANATVGRRLAEVIAIPDSGDAEVDMAIAALIIADAYPTERSTCFTLKPAAWLGYTADPAWKHWHAANRYMG